MTNSRPPADPPELDDIFTRLSRKGVLGRLKLAAKERAGADAEVIAQRFRREDRPAIRRFVSTSPAHGDVVQQFPMLAYLMATKRIPAALRVAAESAIAAGCTLPEIAGIAGAPMWTRAIPPASCVDPRGPLPHSANFACRIGDVLRRRVEDDGDLRGLLRAIAHAHATAGEELAIWLACRYPDGVTSEISSSPLRLLVLWYLMSKAGPHGDPDMIHTRWRRDLSLETAVRATRNFARRIDLELLVGADGCEDPWFPQARIMGLDFIPLLTSTRIREEALRNENCLDTYGQRLAKNEVRVYTVQNAHGQCVANVEIAPSDTIPITPRIAQIKAPKNDPAPAHVSTATEVETSVNSRPVSFGVSSPTIAVG